MDNRVSVSVKACSSYQRSLVEQAVFSIFEEQGFGPKIKPGMTVFVKANLLMKKSPEEFVTTHPSVVEAVCRYIKKQGAFALVGDSPGGPNTEALMRGIYKGCGYDDLEKEGLAKLSYDFSWEEVPIGLEGSKRDIRVLKAVRQADLVINVCKCKTHGMMTFTGAVKNLFGVVPGTHKAAEHFRYVDPYAFGHRLIDLCEEISGDFSLMDAVGIMEGNGPSAGIPRHLGLILGGENPYQVDEVACQIGSIDRKRVPTLLGALRRNLYVPEEVRWDSSALEGREIAPFQLPHSAAVNFSAVPLPRFISRKLEKYLKARPEFDHKSCIGCGRCEESCPAKAIAMNDKNRPLLDQKRCIHCFCCHELCPVKAIEIHEPPLRWLWNRKGR